ncbi:MAG: glycosyltransferase family 2 protein [Ignavibacteriota bacterium]
MSEQKILSIVIVTWNTKDETIACLNSLYNSGDFKKYNGEIEIILIDNNSSDGTSEEVSRSYPSVTLIKNSNNTGYAPACNQGMKIAKGLNTLLLGSDTVIKDNAIADCLNYLNENPECGAVGGKLLFPDGGLQGNCKKFPTLQNAFFTYLSLDRFNKDYDMADFGYDKTTEVDQIATTFLMVRTEILKNINYFNEGYKILYNDVDLCKRIKGEGYKIVFIHSSETFHHGNLSTKKADTSVRFQMYKDIYKYYRENFGAVSVTLIPVLMFRFLLIIIFK